MLSSVEGYQVLYNIEMANAFSLLPKLGYLNRDENWVDEGDKYHRIEALKNSVSLRLTSKEIDKAFHLPFLIDLHEQDPSNWIRSKEATTYEKRYGDKCL